MRRERGTEPSPAGQKRARSSDEQPESAETIQGSRRRQVASALRRIYQHTSHMRSTRESARRRRCIRRSRASGTSAEEAERRTSDRTPRRWRRDAPRAKSSPPGRTGPHSAVPRRGRLFTRPTATQLPGTQAFRLGLLSARRPPSTWYVASCLLPSPACELIATDTLIQALSPFRVDLHNSTPAI